MSAQRSSRSPPPPKAANSTRIIADLFAQPEGPEKQMQFVLGMPFDEAVAKLGQRSIIASKLRSDEWRDVPVQLRERAFFSSQVESLRFLQRARNGIADFLQSSRETLPNGESILKTGSRAQFVDQMKTFLEKEGVDRTTGGITDITSEGRLSLIFDIQTRQANEFGYYKQGMDLDTLDAYPAARFIRVAEVKEPRGSHTQYEDQVYLKTDPIWSVINEDFGVPFAPFGFSCQHEQSDVSREEAEALGLIQPGQRIAPDERSFNDNVKASTRGIDPDLLAKLQEEFGAQIRIEGDAIVWAAGEGAS